MMEEKPKLAIIGASTGQRNLYRKAKDMGLYVVGFACDKGVLTEDLYDEFHEISVTDTEGIVTVCRKLDVKGVVTNASEFLMPLTSCIAERLGLNCTPSETIRNIQNKNYVRKLTEGIPDLAFPKYCLYPDVLSNVFPCVVKPVKGASKKGVAYCADENDFGKAIKYADDGQTEILVEEFIPGREFSVESLSYRGTHSIVQITDKDNSGPPHFVELGHHQPSSLPDSVITRVRKCIAVILDRVGFENGASHIEMKYDEKTDRLFLIEINCRGGGDHISDTLVNLSTDCDYIKEIINISLDRYSVREYRNTGYAGISYLSKQNPGILKYFTEHPQPNWIVRTERTNNELSESTSNYDRDGFIIYTSTNPVNL